MKTRQVNFVDRERVEDSLITSSESVESINLLESDKDLIQFVTQQIQRMKKTYTLGANQNITFDEVNKALRSYYDVQLSLISMYNVAKISAQAAQEEFDNWFAEKYIITREELNPRSISSQKWYSQKEIEMQIRVNYRSEYAIMTTKLRDENIKLAFLRRLLEGWNQLSFVLNTLSKNLIAEYGGAGLEDRLSNTLNQQFKSQYGY